jgi:hypothetical protein
MPILSNSAIGFDLNADELFRDSAKCRAALQNNEDKIEEFNKWSENMVRFVKTILEEASSKGHKFWLVLIPFSRNGAHDAQSRVPN